MIIHKSYERSEIPPSAVATGVFDGVHKGHRAVIDRVVSSANSAGLEPVIITFEPHPREILNQGKVGLKYLTTIDEKAFQLSRLGVKHLIITEFTKELSLMDTCTFVEEILIKKANTRHLVVGFNHQFGSGRSGDFEVISQCAARKGVSVEQAEEITSGDEKISSTVIRNLLAEGDLERANSFLGYYYSLTGAVIKGRAIGRTIGYPTANIEPSDSKKMIPSTGVYAVTVSFDGKMHKGALSIGKNPTVVAEGSTETIEVNIFDFNGDLYGKAITVSFVSRLRDEEKFSSMEELRLQIDRDREKALDVLSVL